MDRRHGADAAALSAPASRPGATPRGRRRRLAAGRRLHVRRPGGVRAARAPPRMPAAIPDAARSARTSRGPSDADEPTGAIDLARRTTTDRRRRPPRGEPAEDGRGRRRARRRRGRRTATDGGHGGGVIVAGLSLVVQRLLRRLLRAYDPWLGWYPTYDTTALRRQTMTTGALRLKVKPVRRVCLRRRLLRRPRRRFRRRVPAAASRTGTAPHRDPRGGVRDLSFDVMIEPDHTTTYRGDLIRNAVDGFIRARPRPVPPPHVTSTSALPPPSRARPADATPGASTMVLITIAKLTMQKSAGAQG